MFFLLIYSETDFVRKSSHKIAVFGHSINNSES